MLRLPVLVTALGLLLTSSSVKAAQGVPKEVVQEISKRLDPVVLSLPQPNSPYTPKCPDCPSGLACLPPAIPSAYTDIRNQYGEAFVQLMVANGYFEVVRFRECRNSYTLLSYTSKLLAITKQEGSILVYGPPSHNLVVAKRVFGRIYYSGPLYGNVSSYALKFRYSIKTAFHLYGEFRRVIAPLPSWGVRPALPPDGASFRGRMGAHRDAFGDWIVDSFCIEERVPECK